MASRMDLKRSMIREDGSYRYVLIGGSIKKQEHVKNSVERAVIGVCRLDHDMVMVYEHIFMDDTLGCIYSVKALGNWQEGDVTHLLTDRKERFVVPDPPPKLEKSSSSKSLTQSKVAPAKQTPPPNPATSGKTASPTQSQILKNSNLASPSPANSRSPSPQNQSNLSNFSQSSPVNNSKITPTNPQKSSIETSPVKPTQDISTSGLPVPKSTLEESIFIPLKPVAQIPTKSQSIDLIAGCNKCIIICRLWLDIPNLITICKISDVHSGPITDLAVLRNTIYSVSPPDKFVAATKLLY